MTVLNKLIIHMYNLLHKCIKFLRVVMCVHVCVLFIKICTCSPNLPVYLQGGGKCIHTYMYILKLESPILE